MAEAEGVRAEVPEETSGAECGRGARKGGRGGLAAELRKRVGKWVEGEDADRIPASEGGTGKHAGRSGETGEERREGCVGEGEAEDYSRKQEEGDGKDPVENANRKVSLFVEYIYIYSARCEIEVGKCCREKRLVEEDMYRNAQVETQAK